MDYQVAFNLAVTGAAFLGGWVLNNISRTLVALDKDVRELPHQYVSKDDFRDVCAEIRASLRRIEDRLDDKADKGRT